MALQKASQAWPDLMPAEIMWTISSQVPGLDFLIDAAVGENFDAMLEKRDED